MQSFNPLPRIIQIHKYHTWSGPEAKSRRPIIHCTSVNDVSEATSISLLADVYLDQRSNFEINKIDLELKLHSMLYLVSYGVLCHCGNFVNDAFHE